MPLQKFFNRNILASDTDWDNWNSLVEEFRYRFVGWYFEPLDEFPKTGHEAFPVMVSMVTVLYSISYLSADPDSSVYLTRYYKVVSELLEDEHKDLSIRLCEEGFLMLIRTGGFGRNVGISGTGRLLTVCDDGVLVIDPWVFRDKVRQWFDGFCDELINDPDSDNSKNLKHNLESLYMV